MSRKAARVDIISDSGQICQAIIIDNRSVRFRRFKAASHLRKVLLPESFVAKGNHKLEVMAA